MGSEITQEFEFRRDRKGGEARISFPSGDDPTPERRREIETIRKIGGSGRSVAAVMVTKIVLVRGTTQALAVSYFGHTLVRAPGS